MDTLDELLPIALSSFVKCLAIVSTAFVVAAVAAPAALAVSPLVFLVFHWLGAYFQRTASQLKRLEKASTGPLFSLYGETLQGVTSIRAFGRQAAFEATLLQRLDQNHRAHFLWTASNRWFAARLDILTASVTLSVGLAVVLFRDQLEPSLAALALTYIVQTTSLFQWGFRMWAEVRNHFVSVERALSYTKLPQEPPAVLPADSALLAQGWPHSAAVSFEAVAMAYRPGLPLVLEHVSFSLPGGVKAAVVGRSGAGKSSLTVALLCLVPLAAGTICIDGVDIASVGLQPYEPRLQPRVPRLRHRTHLRTLRLHLCVLYTPGRPAGAAPRDHLHPAGRGALRWVTPVQPRPLRRALGCNPRGGTGRG